MSGGLYRLSWFPPDRRPPRQFPPSHLVTLLSTGAPLGLTLYLTLQPCLLRQPCPPNGLMTGERNPLSPRRTPSMRMPYVPESTQACHDPSTHTLCGRTPRAMILIGQAKGST